MFSNKNVDSAVNIFYETVNNIIETQVSMRHHCKPQYPIWFNTSLRTLVKNKNSAHKAFKLSNNKNDYIIFTNLRAQCKRETRTCYKNHLDPTQNYLKVNPRYFWKFIKNFKVNNELPTTMYLDNNQAINSLSITNLFKEFFSCAYSPPFPDQHSDININLPNNNIYTSIPNFSLADIFHGLSYLCTF